MKRTKGFALSMEMMVMVIFFIVGLILLLVIYSSVTSDSPGFINTFVNRLLDWLLGGFS